MTCFSWDDHCPELTVGSQLWREKWKTCYDNWVHWANENHIIVWVKFSLSSYSYTQLGVLPSSCGWRLEEEFFFYSPSSYKNAGGSVSVLSLWFLKASAPGCWLPGCSVLCFSPATPGVLRRPIIAAKVSLELLCGPFGSAHVSVVRSSHIICGAKCIMKMWKSCLKKSNKNFKMATAEH